MQTPNRTIVLGLLLAFVATDANAWGKKKKATPPPVAPVPVIVAPPPPPPPPMIYFGDATLPPQLAQADLMATAPAEVQRVANWVKNSRDNANMYFVVLDKVNAQVYFFHPGGHLLATAPVLLGMGKGDKMLVSNATPMSGMPPQKRITPAGRFVSRLGIDSKGKELLILDYDASLSLHPIVKGTPKENRAGRIASPATDDNRISFGCINVPVAFYSNVISPALKNTMGVVYVLPETTTAAALFGFQPDPAAAPMAPMSSSASAAPAVPTAPAVPASQPVSTALGAEAAAPTAPIPGAK
jgi:hypothetical protein